MFIIRLISPFAVHFIMNFLEISMKAVEFIRYIFLISVICYKKEYGRCSHEFKN